MRNKITIILFGLLMAVGWTNVAQAQLLPLRDISMAKVSGDKHIVTPKSSIKDAEMKKALPNQGQKFNAPRRTNMYSVTAPEVRSKAQFESMDPITWTDLQGNSQTTSLTVPYTDANGMMALLKRIYTDPSIPGILHSDPWNGDVTYQTIQYGWNIIGNHYNDPVNVAFSPGVLINAITVRSPGGPVLQRWIAGNSLPSGWSVTNNLSSGQYSNYPVIYNLTNGGTVSISTDKFNNPYGYVNIEVTAIGYVDYYYDYSNYYDLDIGNSTYGYAQYDVTTSWDVYYGSTPGTIDPPDYNGYTPMIVKLKDGVNDTISVRAPKFTKNEAELRDYFNTYIKEIQLLTDGMRVGTGTDNAGTVFVYTGMLNRFFFISKGKMYYLSSLDSISYDRAPFYTMYEEFSPYTQSDTQGSADFYIRMRQKESYPVVHDCNSVTYMQHYFSMSGKKGTTENDVSSLVFYIPDKRGVVSSYSRDYNPEHQPEVGMYIIELDAEAEPSNTPQRYSVTVTWTSNLNDITDNTIPQTYKLYEIADWNHDGKMDTTLIETTHNLYYTYTVPQYDDSYPISYYVIGTPDAATNKDIFFDQSNDDQVIIPGLNDFMALSLEGYESDYVVNSEKNYYRNYLSPKNLKALGALGVTPNSIGNSVRTLVLWRGTEQVGYLDLMMNGDKAYFRIRMEHQEPEPGYSINLTNSSNN